MRVRYAAARALQNTINAPVKILLATDGSPLAEPPVLAVATRPWPRSSVVRVLAVVEIPLPIGPEVAVAANFKGIAEALRKDAAQTVLRVRAAVASSGLAVEIAVREGNVGPEIVDEAKSWDAALILMGSHGRTGLKRVLMGSVAEYVVSHATCSVEIVRGAGVRR